jgi:general secretion pathway protein H
MISSYLLEKQHTARQQHGAGFTLLEILLVIVILAVSATLVAPSFFAATSASVDEEARRLSLALKLASDEAALSGRPFRWSATAHSYVFELLDTEGAWHPANEQPYSEYDLPAGIAIADVQPQNSSLTEDDKREKEAVMARLLLLPEGVIQPAKIILDREDDAGQRLNIQLRPGPGGIQIMSNQNL